METGRLLFKVWLADFCQLTTRTLKGGWNQRHYNPNFLPNVHNRSKRRKLTGQIPKYVRYFFRPNRYGKQDEKVTVYDRPIWLFAIQDKETKMILHACIKQDPSYSEYARFPSFFDVRNCLLETFDKYGKPYALISDGQILRRYKNILNGIRLVWVENPRYLASLESFFARIQYEMRTELNQKNLDEYVRFYNSTKHVGSYPFPKDKVSILQILQTSSDSD
jgi:hypothetical protein